VTAGVHRDQRAVGHVFARRRGHIDHAARGIAIEHRRGAADDLDALSRVEIDRIGLRLSVRQRLGKPVDADAYAAHAERRTRPETAR
jgi:hypothetical protein